MGESMVADRTKAVLRRVTPQSLVVVLAAGVVWAFLALPAMMGPIQAQRWATEGIAGEAMVNGTPGDAVDPPRCDPGAECWERPVVAIDLTGAPARPELLVQNTDIAELAAAGERFVFGTVAHRVPDADTATPVGGTFPVWVLPSTMTLTSEEPPPVWRAVVVSWGWIGVAVAAIAGYAVVRRRLIAPAG